MTSGDDLVYLMEQTALEMFPENDESLEGVFCLPDGTEPFASRSITAATVKEASGCHPRPSP
ncbi:MAG: hypothetical protein ACLR8U_15625 [Oscillospiraceae bacterium]